MKDQNEAQRLIDKYARGLCTPEEKALVESGFLQDLRNASSEISEKEIEAAQQRMLSVIEGRINPGIQKRPVYRLWPKIAAAASFVILFAFGLYFYKPGTPKKEEQAIEQVSIAAPAGNKAYLTLSDGRKILLSDSESGRLAEQSGIVVSKTEDGQLIYTISESNNLQADNHQGYNTIETPKGGQYQVVLPDGTKVWLNSSSSVRFPLAFSAGKREVEVTGEIYFEVAKDADRPFRVSSDHQVVEVLGTHFNVNSYRDDGLTRTTLLEGSVRIQSAKRTIVLKPGEQSLVSKTSQIEAIEQADVEEVMAWKNGDFVFTNSPLVSVTRQLERWYDVEFISSENLYYRFNGKISRKTSLQKVLKMMEITSGAKFKIEGRRVYMDR